MHSTAYSYYSKLHIAYCMLSAGQAVPSTKTTEEPLSPFMGKQLRSQALTHLEMSKWRPPVARVSASHRFILMECLCLLWIPCTPMWALMLAIKRFKGKPLVLLCLCLCKCRLFCTSCIQWMLLIFLFLFSHCIRTHPSETECSFFFSAIVLFCFSLLYPIMPMKRPTFPSGMTKVSSYLSQNSVQ